MELADALRLHPCADKMRSAGRAPPHTPAANARAPPASGPRATEARRPVRAGNRRAAADLPVPSAEINLPPVPAGTPRGTPGRALPQWSRRTPVHSAAAADRAVGNAVARSIPLRLHRASPAPPRPSARIRPARPAPAPGGAAPVAPGRKAVRSIRTNGPTRAAPTVRRSGAAQNAPAH